MTNENTTSGAGKTAQKPKKRRLAIKIVGGIAALVIVLVILAPYILPTAWLARIVETGLKSHVRGPVKIGGVSWGWLGGVGVDKVTVGEPSNFGEGVFLDLAKVTVQVRLIDLLSQKVTIKSVTIDSPKVTITRNEQGAWNFEGLFAGEQRRPPVAVAQVAPVPQAGKLDFAIERIRVKNGSVVYEDKKTNASLTATGLVASVDTDFSGATITGGADISFDLAQADSKGRFEIAASNLSVPKGATADAAQKAAASGTITLTGVEIAEAIAAASPQLGREAASGKLTVAVDYDLSQGNLKLKGKNGSVKGLVLGKAAGFSAPVAVGDAAFSFDAAASQSETTSSLDVASLVVSTPFMEVNSSGNAVITKTAKTISVKANGTIDPSALPKGLVVLPANFKSSGRAKFEAAVTGDPTPQTFAVTIDAGAMGLTYGSVVRKQPGTAAAASVSGSILPGLYNAQKAALTLAGGTITGSGTFNQADKAAEWSVGANFKGVNVADYHPGTKSVILSGGVEHSGKFFLATPKRSSDFAIDTNFDKLSLDVPDRTGPEVVVSGTVSLNSALAQAKGLVVTVGDMPISIEAAIQTPLAKPTGKITVRGKEINVDTLSAVASAFESAAPAAEEPAAPGAPAASQEKTTAEKAQTAGRVYIDNANVNLDVAIERLIYQGFTGNSLTVDAGLVAGKALVRKATVNIFGGTVELTGQANLAEKQAPFDAKLAVAKAQANDLVQRYLSKYLPGLAFTSILDVSMSVGGSLAGVKDAVVNSLSGKGAVDISDGMLSLGALTPALAAILGDLSLEAIRFPKLSVPLELANGTLESDYVLPAGKYGVFVEGKTFLSGGYRQKAGIVLPGTSERLHILTIENGKKNFVDPKEIIGDLAKAQLTGALQKAIQPQQGGGDQKPTKEEQVLQGVESIVDALTKKQQQDSGGTKK